MGKPQRTKLIKLIKKIKNKFLKDGDVGLSAKWQKVFSMKGYHKILQNNKKMIQSTQKLIINNKNHKLNRLWFKS